MNTKIEKQGCRLLHAVGMLAVALATGFGGYVHAQDGTWTGAGTDNNWLNAANWVDSVIPGDWQGAIFSSGVFNGNVNNNAWIGHGAITVDASCPIDIVLGGTSFPKNQAPITVTGANLTFNTDLNAWNDPQTFVVAEGKTLTFNGKINDGGDTPTGARININGAGTVVMTRPGLYNGGTTVNGGTLKTVASNAAGPGAMALASPATWLIYAGQQYVAGLSGAGTIRNASGGLVSTGTSGEAQVSASKNYVLKLDFDNSGTGATVNGVAFTAAERTGTGPAPASIGWFLSGARDAHTGGPNAADSGYGLLLKNFYYYGSPSVLTFSNLAVGNIYEVVVFSDPGWGTRPQDATFANGAESQTLPGTDPVNIGYYAYRFKASASTASVTMVPWNIWNSFHWYGATLEDLTGSPPSASTYSATLTVGDANSYRFAGLIEGDTSLVKQGSGTQTLSGTNAYSGDTFVNAGTLRATAAQAVGPGAMTVATNATWQILDGADQTVAGLSGAGTIAAFCTGAVSTGADGAAQISAGKNYLQLLDFGNGAGATVNGVPFSNVSNNSGTGWSLSGAGTPYFADSGSGYDQLMSDFVFGGNPAVLAFGNLTVGKCYEVMLYTKVDVWPSRWQNATFANGPDSILLLNTDPGTVGYYSYKFEAKAETASVTMVPVIPENTFHWFAASLEELPSTAINLFTNGVTLTVGDANNHRFEGAINGAISLVKLGSGTQTLAGPVAYTGNTTINEGTLKLELPSAPAGDVAVPNNSFETHDALANGNWGNNPSGATWTFDAGSGIAAPGSPWVAGSAVIDGAYAAYIQNNGTLSQQVSIPADGMYLLTFKAANRPDYPASDLNIRIDGVTSSSFPASALNSQGMFQTFTAFAKISAGTRTLAFTGVQNGADSATAIDGITLSGIGGSLSTNAYVSITLGAWLDLGGSTQTVSRLFFDGNEKYRGTHGAVGSGATYTHANWFSGSGILNVLNGKPSGAVIRIY
jgi:autotransporter-associated beta strand protein